LVTITAILLIACSFGLFGLLTADGIEVVSLSASQVQPMGELVLVIDFALMVTFLVLGVRDRSLLVIVLAVLQIVPLAWFEFSGQAEGQDPALLFNFLGLVMVLITSVIGSLICIYAVKYMEHDKHWPGFFAAMLVFLGAMNGAVMCNNLVWFLMFWEATTLCSYLLIRHERTTEAKKSAWRALTITLGGGLALLLGIMLAQHYYGSILLSDLSAGPVLGGLALLPLGFMALAAFTKSAQVPFQSWLLGAMVAPTPVSALLHSATMVNLGAYFLLRLSPMISSVAELQWIVGLVGAFSFLATSILAIGQSSSKRVLAYSTIGNLGLIIMCAAIGTTEALFAGMVLLLFHAISKALLFLSVGVVKHQLGSDDIEPMLGLRDAFPFVSFALLVGVVTILLPPFGVFASKWMISEVALDFLPITFMLALGFGASVVFYAKWLGRAYSAGPIADRKAPLSDRLDGHFKFTLLALIAGAVTLAFLMQQVIIYLISPYLGAVPNDLFQVVGAYGTLPMLGLLLAAAIAVIAIAIAVKPTKESLSQAYTGGEPFTFEVSGAYYISEGNDRKLTSAFNYFAIALLVALFAVPLLVDLTTITIYCVQGMVG
jgi:ech hydrogenase subunit A